MDDRETASEMPARKDEQMQIHGDLRAERGPWLGDFESGKCTSPGSVVEFVILIGPRDTYLACDAVAASHNKFIVTDD